MKFRTPLRRAAMLALLPMMALAGATPARADMTGDVKAINDGWAHIVYEMRGSSTQTKALDQLAKQADAVVARYPGKAEPLLWAGIVTSEQANKANFFHKLGLATRARDLIAKAYAIDPRAADGGPALSLGVLYHKVPGFAWGDDDRALKLLRQALAIDPDGLDTNYFYGDYLLDRGDKAGAKAYLQKALRAPRDASRPVWDAGRRREVRDLLARAA
ncbi:tetratricopeptide repeat protein [Sphingobium amiense]|uniref:Tetratricopeptide repeat protein n=1 Tax=Sphingobium amiense TaxID=135719 RepID=A0A494WG57_9SPHN|nr:tetratricopeptide repeat protein [Sphingobium amiense]BBD99982.1 tetratricopeptide repeat protein [Sphingobium amiense]